MIVKPNSSTVFFYAIPRSLQPFRLDSYTETSHKSASRIPLCSDLKTFFIKKLQTIRTKIAVELTRYGSFLVDLRPRARDILEDFERTTPDEVAKVNNRLQCKNSPMDIIPMTVLKRCVNVFSVALSHLINLSFKSKTFPSVFIVGHVIPLLKKPDMDINDPASYRPITNLMTISKVMERIVFSRLQSHMHQSENSNTYQSAYRSGCSTETALLKVMDDLNASMDSKSCNILLLLDISAAFDMIDIDILLPRLESEFGIIGSVALWICSYLTDRECYVVVGGSRSVAWRCREGVPQGSVLGPLIFSGYVSPLRESSNILVYNIISMLTTRSSTQPSSLQPTRHSWHGVSKKWHAGSSSMACYWYEGKQDRGNHVRNLTTALQTHRCWRTDRNWWHGDCRQRPHQNPGHPSAFDECNVM